MNIPEQPEQRALFLGQFFSHVHIGRLRECWLYGGNVGFYGMFKFKGKQEAAHRIMWRIVVGSIPLGRFVCHRCDVKKCVNPLHLFCGTAGENTQDMMAKGRDRFVGERNGRAKLTKDQVRAIRAEYKEGGISQMNLGRKYHVSEAAIWFIVRNKTWRAK